MKKLFVIFGVLAFAGLSFGQIAGSAHDFSSSGWNTSGEICITCHTPHNAMAITDAPLWNHAESTTATFTTYSSSTLDATVGQPAGVSKLCLSCHDGSVALDSFGGATGSTMISGTADLGADLSTSHPISFTYDATLATNDGELHDPTTTSSTLGGTITTDLLFSNQVECSSCHDVHDAGFDSLLVMSNAASALCLVCHDK